MQSTPHPGIAGDRGLRVETGASPSPAAPWEPRPPVGFVLRFALYRALEFGEYHMSMRISFLFCLRSADLISGLCCVL
jgi:hypothetical protein